MSNIPPTSDFYHINLEGQEVAVNKKSRVVIMTIDKIFRNAGKVLQFQPRFGMMAFGINSSIIKLVEMGKYKLLIHYQSASTDEEYWINYDELKSFRLAHKCEFKVNDSKWIYNIPLKLFKPKPTFGSGLN